MIHTGQLAALMRLNSHGFSIQIYPLLHGLALLVLGVLLIVIGQNTDLHCQRVNTTGPQCQLIARSLFGSRTVATFAPIEAVFLDQRIYEPMVGKRSIVESRIKLVVAGEGVPLNDDGSLKFDQAAVDRINTFLQNHRQQEMQVPIRQSLHLAFLGVIVILFGIWVVKRSILL